MSRISPSAVQSRAKAILEAMQTREVWTYAIPLDAPRVDMRNILKKNGFVASTPSCEPGLESAGERLEERWARDEQWISLNDDEELDVIILRAAGLGAVSTMGQLLELTGFFAQTELLSTAADVEDLEAEQALSTLAHMVCAWDDPWQRLFAQHLEVPELRDAALESLRIAAEQVDDEALQAFVESAVES